MAERVTSVSDETQMTILSPDGIHSDVTDDGLKYLNDSFDRYGPHVVDDSISKAEIFLGTLIMMADN